MGRALARCVLAALVVAAPVLAAPMLAAPGAPQSDLKREYEEILALLQSGDTFEDGRAALRAFVERLAADPDASPALVYHRSKELAEDARLVPDALERGRWFGVAADAALRMGRHDTALWMYEERSRLHEARGDLRAACRVLEEGLAACPEARRQAPHTLVSLADLQRRLGEVDAALESAAAADQAAADAPERALARDKALLVRSAVLRDIGSPERVEAELEQRLPDVAARLARGEVDARHALEMRLEALRVAIARGDHARVRRDAEPLLAEAEEAGLDGVRAQALLLLGTSHLELERQQREAGEVPELRARGHFEAALESGADPAERSFVRTRLVAEAIESGDLDRARQQAGGLREMPLDALPSTVRAEVVVAEARLALASRAPARELSDRRADLVAAWDDLAQAWRRAAGAPGAERGVAFLKYSHRRAVLSLLFQVEMALAPGEVGAEHALAHLLAAQELSTLARRTSRGALSVRELRDAFLGASGRGLLVYLPARDRSHAFAVDDRTVTHHVLPRSATLETHRRAYVSWLLTRGVAAASPAQRAELAEEERRRAAALAAAVLPPDLLARIEAWEHVSVSGTDTLGALPLEWLPCDHDPFLGTVHAVDLVPSLPHAADLAGTAPAAVATDLVLVTDPVLADEVREGWPQLERVGLDARDRGVLDATYGPARWTALEGEQATVERLAELELGAVGVLQLLVHAVEERGAAVPVAFALSGDGKGDGLLRAAGIAGLSGAPRVVLSTACGSGQGPTRRGDPLVASPTGAWLALGARAVVAPLHELTLGEARRTTRVFHGELRGGATPAVAMREVRRDLARDEPQLAPFLHAVQQVVGLGHEALFAPRRGAGAAASLAFGTGRRLALQAFWALVALGLAGFALAWLRSRRTGPAARR